MKFIPNIRQKMRAYSFWALTLAFILKMAPEIWLAWVSYEVPYPYHIGAASLFLGVFGILGWLIDQETPDLWRTAKVMFLSAAISFAIWVALAAPSWAMDEVNVGIVPDERPVAVSVLPTWSQTAAHAVPLIKQWEGTGPTFACSESPSGVCVRAYLDRLPEPDLPTICYGETSHTGTRVSMGDTRTIEHCEEGLSRIARDRYWAIYRRGVTVDHMPTEVDAAMTDLAWNIGPQGVLKASALAALNRGDFADACYRYTLYNRSGGVVVDGLVNRRAAGYAVCMAGVR